MDFIQVAYREEKDGTRTFYPSFQAIDSQDLVIRGGKFAAIWDETTNLYTRRVSHVPGIIDRAFYRMVGDQLRSGDKVKRVVNYDNQLFSKFNSLVNQIGDMGPDLDRCLVFADDEVRKEHAATFRMPYSLIDGECPAWEEIASTLYDPDERLKFEWAIGAILRGDHAVDIQKFYVFFGPPGSGKSTIMNIIEMLFEGHTASFSAYDLGNASSTFSLEPFSKNPLVGVDQDGDLSRIDTNKNLNSVVSHDRLLINAKGKNLFSLQLRTTLFIGSNEPVKISNRKSGLFRRLVDIQPSGRIIDEGRYHLLMDLVKYELGSIATHCMKVYDAHGPTYLSSYRSTDMMYRTNDIFNFVEDHRLILNQGVTLKQAHKLYGSWCEETGTRNVYRQYQFRDLLRDYYEEFHEQIMIDGVRHRSWFSGLRELEKFSWKGSAPKPIHQWLEMKEGPSTLDDILAEMPAQEASAGGTPKRAWSENTTTLKEIDTSKEHFVKVPTQHIVIDFDLKDENGAKDLQRNLLAASHWPATYAEVSRGGGGLHLHYDYVGDVGKLAPVSADGSYEVKVLLGNSSLRRRVSLSNSHEVASISSGLPAKEEKVLGPKKMGSEKGLRDLIVKGLKKEVHQYTKPSLDFIKKVTDDAYEQGMVYDVTDLTDDLMSFAMESSNQRAACIEIVMGLKLRSDEDVEPDSDDNEAPLVIFDLEVYPNLLAIGWMYDRDDAEVVKMINPSPSEVEALFSYRLIGFNNRMYDNHILWAASMGWDNQAIYDLSQAIIVDKSREAMFGQAYNLAYADAYDYIVEKKSLKKWEIDLGLPHMEMDLPWDEPVPEDRFLDVMDYLENDVRSTRAVIHEREADLLARKMLAELSGLTVGHTNKQHTEKMIFGDIPWDTKPDLVYTDLSEMFPGYTFDQFKPGKEKSTYKGENVGEGGYVYAEPGMYTNVALLDVASMHPTSIIELNMFGQYTPRFKELMDQRLEAKRLGKTDPKQRALSDALKIVINSVYGLTAASFPNKFKDDRNIDNIVAKRGALFMVDLKEFLQNEGFQVVHIKTDSVKIPNATPEIIEKVSEFGARYGYSFEHEATYERFCLVNDAVYVARENGVWSATGKQFQHPVVFKSLFTKEELEFNDFIEVKQVQKGAMYLVSDASDVRHFVGRFGAFVPVHGGRSLLRVDGDKEGAVTGTKGYLWELDEFASDMPVDMDYFAELVNDAKTNINKYGSFEEFVK